MKKILILIYITLLLSSLAVCKKDKKNDDLDNPAENFLNEPRWVIKESGVTIRAEEGFEDVEEFVTVPYGEKIILLEEMGET